MSTQTNILDKIIESAELTRDHWMTINGVTLDESGNPVTSDPATPAKRQVARRLREVGLYNDVCLTDVTSSMYHTLTREIEEYTLAQRIHLSKGEVQSLRSDFRDFIPGTWTEGMVRVVKSAIPSGFVTFAKPVDLYSIGRVDAISWSTRDKSFFDASTDGLAITTYRDEPFILDTGVSDIVIPARQVSGVVLNVAYPDSSVSRLDLRGSDTIDQRVVEASILEQLGLILSAISRTG